MQTYTGRDLIINDNNYLDNTLDTIIINLLMKEKCLQPYSWIKYKIVPKHRWKTEESTYFIKAYPIIYHKASQQTQRGAKLSNKNGCSVAEHNSRRLGQHFRKTMQDVA